MARDHRHKRLPGTSLGRAALDDCLAARLYSILGLGQSAAFVRRRRILSCAGLWWGSSLLISSQAVSSLAAGLLWSIDVGWRLITGRFLVGGTEYMWDTRVPVWVRLLSSFHLALPLALLWAMRKIGYDRRALALQAAIAAALFIASRFLPAGFNMNYVYDDPLFHRSWGPAPAHLVVIFVGAVALLYWPTHLVLGWLFPVASIAR